MRPVLSLLCVLVLSACASTSPGDPVAAVTSRFNAGIEAFNRHDIDGFLDQFGSDVEMYTPTGWLRGSDAVRARFVETFTQFPKVKMETENLRVRTVAPNTVIVDFTWRVFPGGAGPAFHGLSSGVYVQRNGQWVEVLEHETVTKVDAPLPGAR